MKDISRIMVVDDDLESLLVVKIILERSGYDVLAFDGCEDLIEHIQMYQPALIFMDHHMRDMTGLEATRLIKSHGYCKHIPVVYFTSNTNIKELAELAGADAWLSKPFVVDDMIKVTGMFL